MRRSSIRYTAEAVLVRWFFRLMRGLPLDVASATGGRLARMIGCFLPVQQTAMRNLCLAMPETTKAEQRRILSAVWDNLGRVAAELPWLGSDALRQRVEVTGEETIAAIRTCGNPVIFVSGHYGNWELATWVANLHGIPLALVYRAANNKAVDAAVQQCRAAMRVIPHQGTPENATNRYFPKGKRALLRLVQVMEQRQAIGMLVDQKFNDGMELPFFGHPAMTATTVAELALKYNAPIIPFRAVRLKGCRFRAEVLPPLEYATTEDHTTNVTNIMTAIHHQLEGWIREHPEQWFWLHRRWKQ